MKRTFIAVALCLFSVSLAYAQDKEKDAAPEYEFTVVKENPISSIKDQHRSGTCWCFSALSFLESEIMRTKGYDDWSPSRIMTELSNMCVLTGISISLQEVPSGMCSMSSATTELCRRK